MKTGKDQTRRGYLERSTKAVFKATTTERKHDY